MEDHPEIQMGVVVIEDNIVGVGVSEHKAGRGENKMGMV